MKLNIVQALSDPNRYLDVFPMGAASDGDPNSFEYTDDADKILFYDFMVRSMESDEVYCEVENVSPDRSIEVDCMLSEIYGLNCDHEFTTLVSESELSITEIDHYYPYLGFNNLRDTRKNRDAFFKKYDAYWVSQLNELT